MHRERRTIVGFDEPAVLAAECRRFDVNLVTALGHARSKSRREIGGTVDVWREGVAPDEDTERLLSVRNLGVFRGIGHDALMSLG